MDIVVPRLRAARADDAAEACPLIYSAGPELLDYAFTRKGRSALDFLTYGFSRGRGLLGYQLCTVAEVEGWVVGTVSVYSAEEYFAFHRQFVWEVVRYYGPLQARTILRRMRHLGTVLPAIPRDAAYVSSVAVEPRWRKRGVGAALVEWAVDRATRAGFQVIDLDVSTRRPEAQRLYERLGFKVVGLNTFDGEPVSEPIPDYRRMELLRGVD